MKSGHGLFHQHGCWFQSGQDCIHTQAPSWRMRHVSQGLGVCTVGNKTVSMFSYSVKMHPYVREGKLEKCEKITEAALMSYDVAYITSLHRFHFWKQNHTIYTGSPLKQFCCLSLRSKKVVRLVLGISPLGLQHCCNMPRHALNQSLTDRLIYCFSTCSQSSC
jgi:hypothetical protein